MRDYIPLAISATHLETPDALSVSLTVPEPHREAFRYRPGQHLAVRAIIDGEELRRTYSICSSPDDRNLTITIKRVAGGRFSGWAFETLARGASLDAMPPAGRFILPEVLEAHAHILAVAAGSGITPVMAIAEHALRRTRDTRVTLIYGNRDLDSIIFRERLEDLKDAFMDRMTVIHVLSREHDTDTPLLEGRISAEKITTLAGHAFDIAGIDHAFVCGPGTMIRDVRAALMQLGLPRERAHHEFFAAAGAQAEPSPARPEKDRPHARTTEASASTVSEVVAVIDGSRRRFSTRGGETVLEAALRAGVRVPFSCKAGMCSTCRGRIVEGHVTMRVNYSLEPWELERGFVLTCQAEPASDLVVIDYDEM